MNEIDEFVLTDRIDREFDVFDRTIAAEDLAQVGFVDVLCELLNNNLRDQHVIQRKG